MVTVHYFRTWNAVQDGWIEQPLKSPADRINKIGGQIIEGTGEDVPESALDSEGRYNPDA